MWTKNLERDVDIIRSMLGGTRRCDVARRYGISGTRVYQIMCKFERRRRWVEVHADYYMDENFTAKQRRARIGK